MLKKLRIKFIALNMVTVAVVLTVVFAAIAVMISPLFSVMTQMPAYQ